MKPRREFELVGRGDADPGARRTARARLTESLPPSKLRDLDLAAPDFLLDDDLRVAVNMALAVGAPLLLTGAPGTGKTQVAHWLAWYFEISIYSFHVKSTSTASDLKYDFDAVAYLRYAQDKTAPEMPRMKFVTPKALWQAFDSTEPCVLLIDEIDKAPRDFPNDLLHELDQLSFVNPFVPDSPPIRPKCPRPPIVVVTSNAERRLPDAFLRRCIAHRIVHDQEVVKKIVKRKVGVAFPAPDDAEFVPAALERFQQIQSKDGLSKPPGTAELLTWLAVMIAEGVTTERVRSEVPVPAHQALIKDAKDYERLWGR